MPVDFEALFVESPTPSLIVAPPSWTIVAANRARLRVTETTLEQQIGRALFEIFPDDPADPTADGVRNLRASLERVMQTKQPDTMPIQRYAVRDLEGRFVERWWSPINTPVLDAQGEVAYVLHQVEEVTETVQMRGTLAAQNSEIHAQRRLAAALRESEARYRTLFEAVDAGFCVMEMKFDEQLRCVNYRYAEVNPAFERQTGVASASGKWIKDLVPDLEPHWFDIYGRVALTGEPTRFEAPADPVGRWYDVHAFRIGKPEQRQVAILFNDITARRQAEIRLRELNETLEAQVTDRSAERDRLWALSQDILARADYTGMMSAVSPAWGHVLGWSEAELLTRGYATFMHPEDMPPTLSAIAGMSQTGLPTRFENRMATKGGGWRSIDWTVTPEPDGLNFIAVGRDVTENRARERELLLAQEHLRQSQKMEAMGQLTGGVAHDFNNLLMPIVGSLDMLQRRGLGDARERRLIDGAVQSAERAKLLVQRLLAFARRQPLQRVAVDLHGLVLGMADLISSTVGPSISVRTELDGSLPPASADPNQLEMAILNLAVNARDAMPSGGALTLSARTETIGEGHRSGLAPGRYLYLAVSDTGSGMDDVTREHAIEPFFSTKGIGCGTGLGLSMVHGLTAQLGGALTILSAVGEGTTVELWLPTSDRAWEAPGPARPGPPSGQARGRALLVDDEHLVRMTTADMLVDLGFEVVEADSASQALSALEGSGDFDLVVTDHLMPGGTGVELGNRIRAVHPALPILIVSGYADAEGISADLPRLTKPFRSSELADAVALLLSGRAPATTRLP